MSADQQKGTFFNRWEGVIKQIDLKVSKRKGAKRPDPFMEGIAIALADLVRLYDQPSMAAGVLAGHGFALADFKGVDPYDLNVIRKLYRTESVLIDAKGASASDK
jgi:hypothetical protein